MHFCKLLDSHPEFHLLDCLVCTVPSICSSVIQIPSLHTFNSFPVKNVMFCEISVGFLLLGLPWFAYSVYRATFLHDFEKSSLKYPKKGSKSQQTL